MAQKLDGKVALVTGASSGIGEATAFALSGEGAKVAIAARREERLKQLADKIENQGGEALVIPTDATDEGQTRDMVRQTKEHFGRLDILVNNAGIMLTGGIDGANTDDWRRMVDINMLGLMYATHAALPIMKEQGSGHIVNMSSVAGRVAMANFGVYNATKFGVGAFSEALRQEVLDHKIRVTAIEPGVVDTELPEHITDREAKQQTKSFYQSMVPLESEDIAAAIIYAVTQSDRVNVNEILIRPTEQQL